MTPSTSEPLNKSLHDLKDIFDSARCYFEMWSALAYDVKPSPIYLMPAGIREVLLLTRFAYYKCMVLDLYMVLDTHTKAASLRKVPEEALRLGVISRADNDECIRRIKTIQPTWEQIRDVRHRLFAHVERGTTYAQIMAELSLNMNDFEAFIDEGLQTLNIVWSKYFAQGPAVFSFERDHNRKQTGNIFKSLLPDFQL